MLSYFILQYFSCKKLKEKFATSSSIGISLSKVEPSDCQKNLAAVLKSDALSVAFSCLFLQEICAEMFFKL